MKKRTEIFIIKNDNKKVTNPTPDIYSDELFKYIALKLDKIEFDKPLKLTQTVKMIGAPSDYNEEMDKWDKMMAEKESDIT